MESPGYIKFIYRSCLRLAVVFSLFMAGFTYAQPNLTDQQLIDKINQQPPLSNGQLKNILLQNSPLSDIVLIAMLNRNPALPGGMTEEILSANSPLSDAVLIAMLNVSPQLPNGNLSNVLIKESPLSTEVLTEVGNLENPLPGGTIENIVGSNPLSASVAVTNVNCFGESNGAVNLSVTGGIPPYTFNWSNGAATEDLNNIIAGFYSVTVTDLNGFNTRTSADVTEPGQLILSTVAGEVTCNGGSNGAVHLTVSGGSAPYTYLWSFEARTTQDISNLPAGSYTVTVTDAHSCTATSTTEVTQPPAFNLTTSITNILCHGGNNGSIDLTVTGSVPPYSYNWSNGAVTEDIFNLNAGNYTVTVTDSRSCITINTYTVSEPAELSLFISNMNISCNGANNGSIDITVNGGTQPYTYLWSNGAITQDIAGLPPGTYTVTVTDANGCVISNVVNGEFTGTVTEPAPLLLSTTTVNVSCYGQSTGSIDLTVTGGVTPYSYSWSNATSSEDIMNLAAGSYTVTVTDANSCLAINTSDISQSTEIILSVDVVNVSCHGGSNGSADLTASGGVPPYAFLWSGGETTEDIIGKTAGNYTVSVTDNNSCQVTAVATISQPAPLQLSALAIPASCYGANNGSIDLAVSGGTFPYSYTWSNNTSSEDPMNLTAGNYSVTVTDLRLCTASASAAITQPADIILSASLIHVNCNGGSDGAINLSVSGGYSPFAFQWSGEAVTEDLSGIAAGNYTVTATDANGCNKSATFIITQPAVLSALHYVINASSAGGSDGAILLVTGGGTKPYQYLWSNGVTTKDAEQLAAGTYSVTVTDAKGCTYTTQDEVGIQSGGGEGICLHNKELFVKITEGIKLKVFGTVDNNNGLFDNSGIVSITKDFINNSNNGGFSQQSGEVILTGNSDQVIKGNHTVDMHHLTLSGGGVKRLTNNLDIYGTLNIQDRELAAGSRTLTIKNTDPAAVATTTGIVSNTDGGKFIRAMASTSPYLFPVGSSDEPVRYRPVEIIPVSSNLQSFSVRMVNNSPELQGYNVNSKDNDLIEVNSNYYHIVNSDDPITEPVDIKFYFDSTVDGLPNAFSFWNDVQWSPVRARQILFDISKNLSFIKVEEIIGLANKPFAWSKTPVAVVPLSTNEDILQKGSVNIQVFGAHPPYVANWDHLTPFPSRLSFEEGRNNIAGSEFFISSGIPSTILTGLEYYDFVQAGSPLVLTEPGSNRYNVTVTDTMTNSTTTEITLGVKPQWYNQSGMDIQEDKIEKTSPDGWENASVTSLNYISSGESGEFSFSIARVNTVIAAGLKDVEQPETAGYEDLKYAFVVDNGNVKIWKDNVLGPVISQYNLSDRLSISVEGMQLAFKKNDNILETSSMAENKTFQVQFPVYTKGATIYKINFVKLPYWPQYTATVNDAVCDMQGGSIDISIKTSAFFNSFTFEWKNETGAVVSTSEDISGLAPGNYSLTISYQSIFPIVPAPIVKQFSIANKVNWSVINNASLLSVPNSNSVRENAGFNTGNAESLNSLKGSDNGWLSFKANSLDVLNAGLIGFNTVIGNTMEYGMFIPYWAGYGMVLAIKSQGQWQQPLSPVNVNIGDVLKIELNKTNTVAVYYKNNSFFRIAPISTGNSDLKISTSLWGPGAIISDAKATFCDEIFKNQSYAVLSKKTDGGLYRAEQGRLFFKYDGEYNSGILNYKVYGNSQQTPLLSSSSPSPINNSAKNLGDNRYILNTNNLLDPGTYTLVVENEKKEKYQLKFKKPY